MLYEKVIRPRFLKHQGEVDDAISNMAGAGKTNADGFSLWYFNFNHPSIIIIFFFNSFSYGINIYGATANTNLSKILL